MSLTSMAMMVFLLQPTTTPEDVIRQDATRGFDLLKESRRSDDESKGLQARQIIVEAYLAWVESHGTQDACTMPEKQKRTKGKTVLVAVPVSASARQQAERMLDCLESRPTTTAVAKQLRDRVKAHKQKEVNACKARGGHPWDENVGILGGLGSANRDPCAAGVADVWGPSGIEELLALKGGEPVMTKDAFRGLQGVAPAKP